MIDYFALALTHGLLLVALLRLARRGDVDQEADPAAPAAPPPSPDAPAKPAKGAAARRRDRKRRRDA